MLHPNDSILEFDCTVRVLNCFKRMGIKTIGDLVRLTANDLIRELHFGRKSLREVQEELHAHGLHLFGDPLIRIEGIEYDAFHRPMTEGVSLTYAKNSGFPWYAFCH